MNKLFIALFSLSVLGSCNSGPKSSKDDQKKADIDSAANTDINYHKADLIQIADSAWGSVTKNSNYKDLLSIYGEQSVKDERICGPECIDSLDVTQVYPGTEKAFTIYWKEKRYHQKIDMIICDTEMSPYRTASDIGIGSSLQDLLELNGQQISFYGFGWDYGGGIISFNGGRLEKSRIHYNLEMPYDSTGNALLGDREFNTGMPDVQKRIANIFVNKLILSFP